MRHTHPAMVLPKGVIIGHVFVGSSRYGDPNYWKYTEAQAVAKGVLGIEEHGTNGARRVQIFRSLVEVVLIIGSSGSGSGYTAVAASAAEGSPAAEGDNDQ